MDLPIIFMPFTEMRGFAMNKKTGVGFFSIFSLWAGAAISLAEILTGGLLAPLGLKKGILLILLGHLIGCLILAFTGIIGFKEKKPSLIASRVSLGRYGSYLVSIFNIIQLIGWTAIMLIQCANATGGLLNLSSRAVFIAAIIVTGLIVIIWAFFLIKSINLLNNIAVGLLFLLCAIILGMILLNSGHSPAIVAGSISVGAALELSIIMPLSWVPLISDYSMSARSARGSFWGSFIGYFVASSFMYIIGLAAAVYTGSSSITGILGSMRLGAAALAVVVLATVTTTYVDVYSAVMSAINIGPKLSKKALIVIVTGIGTVTALIFPMENYQGFLYIIGSAFAPIFAVILTDYFLFKADRSKIAVNIVGIFCAGIGAAVYYLFISLDLPFGSTLPSMFITATLYAVIRLAVNKYKTKTPLMEE